MLPPVSLKNFGHYNMRLQWPQDDAFITCLPRRIFNNTQRSMKQFFLSCPKGLESLLEEECRKFLGESLTGLRASDGGIKVDTDIKNFLPYLLSTRLASRGYMQLGQWPINRLQDLYDLSRNFEFESWMDWRQTFKITTLFDLKAKYVLNNSLLASQIFKDGLVDRFRDVTGNRPTVDVKHSQISFLLRIEESRNTSKIAPFMLTFYVDMTGIPLSNRGYRAPGHEAPLRENIAAAMVMWANFGEQAEILVDPFVGTGTILIESAMILAKVPPSFLKLRDWTKGRRPYDMLEHLWFQNNSALNSQLSDWANTQVTMGEKSLLKIPSGILWGSDLDPNAILLAKKNLARLGLDRTVRLSEGNALTMMPPGPPPGVVVTNPPYGERMGTPEESAELFFNLSEHLKNNYKGYRAYLLAGDPKMHKGIHLKTSCKKPVRNGDIECRVLGYNLF